MPWGPSVTYGAASMEQAVGEYLTTRLGMNLVNKGSGQRHDPGGQWEFLLCEPDEKQSGS